MYLQFPILFMFMVDGFGWLEWANLMLTSTGFLSSVKIKGAKKKFAKNTIQVPPGGYVIMRIPLNNQGTWFMHCHINKHLLDGMAMVLQIGGFGEDKTYGQDW